LGNPVGSLGGYDDAAAKAEVGPDRGDAHLAMEGIALTGWRTRSPRTAVRRKYFGSDTLFPDGKHAWLRVTPEKLTSWDFRKLYPPSAASTRWWAGPDRVLRRSGRQPRRGN